MELLAFLVMAGGVGNLYAGDNDFEFVALGDTSYTESTYPEYEALIETINSASPQFTIHVGDTMGHQDCSDATYDNIERFFGLYDHPVIYTPGDNEWTDCWDAELGKSGWQPQAQGNYKLDRLNAIRERFFPDDYSLGKDKILLTRQSDTPEFKEMVENVIWKHNEILFATLHIVGSANGLHPHIEPSAKESVARSSANFNWIEKIKTEALETNPKAVVIAFHAQVFDRDRAQKSERSFTKLNIKGGSKGPYYWLVYELSVLAKEFGKPILMIHGDYHEFIVDRPFHVTGKENEPENQNYSNVTRLQVYGAPEQKAVKIKVEPDTPWVFSFSPLHN